MATVDQSGLAVTSFSTAPSDIHIGSLLVGTKWGGAVGQGVTITYSFPGASAKWSSLAYGTGSEPYTDYHPLTDSQKALARQALNAWSEVANIRFVEVAESGDTVGDIRFAFSGKVAGWGMGMYPADNWPRSGDIWISSKYLSSSFAPEATNYSYMSLIHELGHVLGLKHPQDPYGPFGTLPVAENDREHTVMSYTDVSPLPYAWATTPMPYDILAIQHLYGANAKARAGDDVYTLDGGTAYVQSIWDTGGKDSLRFAGAYGAVIDLREGHWSSAGNAVYGDAIPYQKVYIAPGVKIENAAGGSGGDRLTGNGLANVLDGGAGADTMAGGAGNDSYFVGSQGDVVVESSGQGVDLVKASISYSLVDTDGAGAQGGNVENILLLGTAAIKATGNGLNNVIYPNLGSNVLDGGAGTDTVSYQYAKGAVTVGLSSTSAQATGGSGSDTLVRIENLIGSPYGDSLSGNGGANSLNGGAGADTLAGGDGNDSFTFSAALGTGMDTIADFVSGIDRLRLDDGIFKAVGVLGNFSATDPRFHAAAGARSGHDASDRIVYDTTSGALYYDADGSGSLAAMQFAFLGVSSHPGLKASDVTII